jgi:hypothetical protein
LLAKLELVAPNLVLSAAPPNPVELVFVVEHIKNGVNAGFGLERGPEQVLGIADAEIDCLGICDRLSGEKPSIKKGKRTEDQERTRAEVHGNKSAQLALRCQ